MTLYQDYKTPTDVLIDKTISRTDKIKILKQWCEDEDALMRASAEGLAGGERPNLQRVREALQTLEQVSE